MARLQLLLVDPDLRAQRLTAAGLSRSGFTVTALSSADEALARLRAHPVDGVVCAATLPGAAVSALRESLRGDPSQAHVPFVLLVNGGAPGSLSRWEPLAPVEVVTRPVALGDLVARVRAALDAAVRRRLEAGTEQAFHSSVDRMSVLDLVEFFRSQARSGVVELSGPRDGRLAFYAGAPVDAVAGVQAGREAFFRLLSAREGDYQLRLEETSSTGNLEGPADVLLDEGIAFLEAWDRALEQVPPLSSVLEQDAVRVAEVQGTLPEEAGWVLRLVDGERTLGDLVEASTLGSLAVLEIVARLYFEGLVSVRKGGPVATRRPRVDEWLNSPPVLARETVEQEEEPSSRKTQILSRDDFPGELSQPLDGPAPESAPPKVEEAPAEPVPVLPSEDLGTVPAPEAFPVEQAAEPPEEAAPGFTSEELEAFQAWAGVPVDAPESPASPAAPALSREALEPVANAAVPTPAQAPDAPSARTTQLLSREEMEAVAAAGAFLAAGAHVAEAHPARPVAELEALAAAAAPLTPPSEPSTWTTHSLAREELGAAAGDPAPLPVAAPAAGRAMQALTGEELSALGAVPPDPASPPTLVPAAAPATAPATGITGITGVTDDGGFPMGSSGTVADPAPFGLVQSRGAERPAPASSPEGTFPFHFARAQAEAPRAPEAPPVDRRAEVSPESLPQETPTPVPVPVPGPVPSPASAPQAVPAAPVIASLPVASQQDVADDGFIPVKRNWGFAAVAAGGVLLVGLGAYFATRTSNNTPEQPVPVAAAPVEPPPAPAEAAPEPDAGAIAEVETVPGSPDAGAVALETAPLVATQPAIEAAAEAAPPPEPKPLAAPPPAAPVAAAPASAPASVKQPVAVALPVNVAPAARSAGQNPPPPDFDLARVNTPPPQGATSQDRVAPGPLPRKASRPQSVTTSPAAGTPPPVATDLATALKGAKRAQQVGNWKAAVDGYRKALALGADTPDVKAGLGISLVSTDPGLRGYQEATLLLNQALAQDGGNANAWLSLGMAYQFTGNTAEAVKAYKRYLALAPAGKSAAEVRTMLERL